MSWNEEEIASLKGLLLSPDERNMILSAELIKQKGDALPFAELLLFLIFVKRDWQNVQKVNILSLVRKFIPQELEESIRKDISVFQNHSYGNERTEDDLITYLPKRQVYEGFMKLNGEYAYPYYNLGSYLVHNTKKVEKGLDLMRLATEFCPNDMNYHFEYAYNLPEIPKNYESIRVHYERCYALGMKDRAIYHNLGRVYLHFFGDFEKAKNLFEEGLSLNKGFLDTMVSLAATLKQMGKKEEAEQLLLEVVTKDTKHALAHNNLSFLYLDSFKDFEKARIHVESAVKIDTKQAIYWHTLAEVEWYGYRDAEKAIAALDKATKVDKAYKAAGVMKKKIEKEIGK